MPKFKPKVVKTICSICGTQFDDPDNGLAPTCGSPSCIREARKRGMALTPRVAKGKLAKGSRRRASKVETTDAG
jgi:hypothetical protein